MRLTEHREGSSVSPLAGRTLHYGHGHHEPCGDRPGPDSSLSEAGPYFRTHLRDRPLRGQSVRYSVAAFRAGEVGNNLLSVPLMPHSHVCQGWRPRYWAEQLESGQQARRLWRGCCCCPAFTRLLQRLAYCCARTSSDPQDRRTYSQAFSPLSATDEGLALVEGCAGFAAEILKHTADAGKGHGLPDFRGTSFSQTRERCNLRGLCSSLTAVGDCA
jgi:hypothetical protein